MMGRALSALCKSITKPLTVALQTEGILATKENYQSPSFLHVLFSAVPTQLCWVYSYSYNHSPFPMGIPRIRTPKGAPSRSAAKLAEGFKVMIPEAEYEARVSFWYECGRLGGVGVWGGWFCGWFLGGFVFCVGDCRESRGVWTKEGRVWGDG